MKYFVIEPFTAETQQGEVTIPVGKILELSQDQALRLNGKICLADESNLWRWFVLEADRVFRSSPKVADSWEHHKEHRKAAQGYCNAGDIPAARAELVKALTALRGATTIQPDSLSI